MKSHLKKPIKKTQQNPAFTPIRSDESDIDEYDADPNFQLVPVSKAKVVPTESSSSSSNTSRARVQRVRRTPKMLVSK